MWACGSGSPGVPSEDAGCADERCTADGGGGDTGAQDSGDSGVADTGATDSGAADSNVADSQVTDSSSADSGAVDSGPAPDSGGDATPGTFSVGGTISGLTGTLVLQDNGSDDYATMSNGSFAFPTLLSDGAKYAVTVLTQPAGQTCTVGGTSSGTISGANVTGVSVTCATSTYSIGGTVSGLVAGNSVTLQDNGGDSTTLSANGAFTFSTKIANGGAYDVEVLTQPTNPPQVCTVSAGSGHAGGNVTSVTVNCASDEFTVGGTVAGLQAGQTVHLQDNGGDDLYVSSNGTFAFPTPLMGGSTYLVTADGQNTLGLDCTVTNGTGSVSAAMGSVTDVTVSCVTTDYWVYGAVTFANTTLLPGAQLTLSMTGTLPRSKTIKASGLTSFAFPCGVGAMYTLSVSTQPDHEYCSFAGGACSTSGTMGMADVVGVNVTCQVTNGGPCSSNSDCQSGKCVYIGDLEATQVGWTGTTTGKTGLCYSADDANEMTLQQQAAMNYAPLIYLAADENYFPSSVESLLQNEVVDCIDNTSGAELTPGMNATEILSPLPAGSPLASIPASTQSLAPCGPTPPGAQTPHDGCCRLNLKPAVQLHGGLDCNAAFNTGPGGTGTGTMSPLLASDCSSSAQFALFKGDGAHLSSSAAGTDASVVPIYATIYGYGPGWFNVEYKTFYPYNYGKQACAGLWNSGCQGNWTQDDNHVGDWEGMSIQFVNYKPAAVRTAAHSTDSIGTTYLSDLSGTFPGGGNPAPSYPYPSGFIMSGEWQVGSGAFQGADSRPWSALQWSNTHPIVYAASGSHGIWGDTGDTNNLHNYQIIGTGQPLYDHTTQGRAWETWRHLVVIEQQGQAVPWYSQYKGRWGEDPVTAGETSGGCTSPVGFTDGRQNCGACQGYDCSACQVAGLQNVCPLAAGGYQYPGFSLCFGSDTEYQLNSGPFTPNGVRDVPTLPSRLTTLAGSSGFNAIQLPLSDFQPCAAGASSPTCPAGDDYAYVVNPFFGAVTPSDTGYRASTFKIAPGLDPTVVDGVSIEAFTLETDGNSTIGNTAWFNPSPTNWRYYLTKNGSTVDVEAVDVKNPVSPAQADAMTFKMHQNPANPNSVAAFESYAADLASAVTTCTVPATPPPATQYLTGGAMGLSLAPSTTDPVASNETSLLFTPANPYSKVQPGDYYYLASQAPLLTWNNGSNASWGCAALHFMNNTDYWAWVTVYDQGLAGQIKDHLAIPPGTEWTLTDGGCSSGYLWGTAEKVRAQIYATFQDLQADQNQVYDTEICIMPEYQGAVIWAILGAAYVLFPELTTTVLEAVFAAEAIVASCDANAAKVMASFALDVLDSNGAATQTVLKALSTSFDNLTNDNTSVGLWHGMGNFFLTNPGFTPSDGGGNGTCAFGG
jgi:hypothetical protein